MSRLYMFLEVCRLSFSDNYFLICVLYVLFDIYYKYARWAWPQRSPDINRGVM